MKSLDPKTAKKIDALSETEIIYILEQIQAFEKESESPEFVKTTKKLALYFINIENGEEGAKYEKKLQRELKFLMEKFLIVVKKQKKVEAVFRAYLVDILIRKVERWLNGADLSKKFAKLAATVLLSGGITTGLAFILPQIPGIPFWAHLLILSAAVSILVGLGIHLLL